MQMDEQQATDQDTSLRPKPSPEFIAVCVLVVAYVAWLLSLPAWPSQDGPVHLYYTQVLGRLLTHTDPVYHRFYSIKHLLPPYALYYYALLLLSKAVPLLLADRVVVCVYLVAFVFGFRYLAQAIGPHADRATLVATLLVLNWPLGMGFVNFCLSVALSLWTLGLWLRLRTGDSLRRRFLFLLSVAAVTLAHPVPLLFVLLVCGLDLFLRRLNQSVASERRSARRLFRRDAATLVLAAFSLMYVKAFTVARPLEQRTAVTGSALHRAGERWIGYLEGKNLAFLLGHGLVITAYRLALLVVLAGALERGFEQWRKGRAIPLWTAGDTFFVLSVAMLLGLPWLPSDLSGAYFFTERLTLLLWVTALLSSAVGQSAASKAEPLEQERGTWLSLARTALLVVIPVLTALLLAQADRLLRPFAQVDKELSRTSLPIAGKVGLVLESAYWPPSSGAGPSWNPNYWSGVGVIRSGNAVLDNAPWLDSPIIPLAPLPTLPGATLSPLLANSPHALTQAMEDATDLRSLMLSSADLLVFTPVQGAKTWMQEPILADLPTAAGAWTCQATSGSAYRLCRRSATH